MKKVAHTQSATPATLLTNLLESAGVGPSSEMGSAGTNQQDCSSLAASHIPTQNSVKFLDELVARLTAPPDKTVPNYPYPPLEQVTRPTVPTDQAAYYLNRRPQTMRSWACLEPTGAIRPMRIMGRLAWPVVEIKALLNGVRND